MINRVLLGLMLVVAVGVVVVGSTDTARVQPASVDQVLVSQEESESTTEVVRAYTSSFEKEKDLSVFTTLAQSINLADLLQKKGGVYTILAPTNAAFERLMGAPGEEAILSAYSKEGLTALLGHHVIVGTYNLAELVGGVTLPTLQGETVSITQDKDGSIRINGEPVVISTDETLSGSLVYVIDTVLVPKALGGDQKSALSTMQEDDALLGGGQYQLLCTDSKDGTYTIEKQFRKKILGIFWGGWETAGDPSVEKGTCADRSDVVVSDTEKPKKKHRQQCVASGSSYTVGVQEFSGWWIFGSWQFLPGATTGTLGSPGAAASYCEWYNGLYGDDISWVTT